MIYDKEKYYDKNEIFLYKFDDKPNLEIVLKLYNRKNNNMHVITLTDSYSAKGNIYGFNNSFILVQLKDVKNIEDVKNKYPQYFI